MTYALIGIAVTIAVTGVLSAMMRAAHRGEPRPGSEPGELVFRYSALFRAFSFFAAIGVPALIRALVVVAPPKAGELRYVLPVYAIFLGIGAPLFWQSWRFAVIASPKGLDCRSPWRGRTFLAWNDVAAIDFDGRNRRFIVRASSGRTFQIPLWVAGLVDLLAVCEKNLPLAALAGAATGYATLGRRFPAT